MKNLKLLGLLKICAFFSTNIIAQTKIVGGAEMFPTKNIVENAMNSKDHTTLVAALKAADLVSTLESRGPFTVFAPANSAFAALPAGTVENLLKPENKKTLTSILTYHVISGKFSAEDLMKRVNKENGKATMRTVQGENLYFTMKGGKLMITDSKGNTTDITIADVNQSNGVIHVIDKVLMP
ncbi:MAG: fasciclin domain-containing protein [Ginsengibacter sp.]